MADKIITPDFGGPKRGGGDPPDPPPPLTYEELQFKVDQQADMIQHLKKLLVRGEEDLHRSQEALKQAQQQLIALIQFCGEGAKILEMSRKNLEVIGNMLPKPR